MGLPTRRPKPAAGIKSKGFVALAKSKFCILILSYNHPEITARAIQSALKFVSSEIIFLIHNGSETRHQLKLQNDFPSLNHLILDTNKGYSGGVNFGLKQVFSFGYDWAFLLTNDCQLIKLNTPSNDSITFLNPSFIAPMIWRRKIGIADSLAGRFNPNKAHIYHLRSEEDFRKNNQFEFNYIPGSAFWIHRKIFELTGALDESLGTYWEDVDYSVRVLKSGGLLNFDIKTELLHQVGKTNHKDPFYTSYLFLRNKAVVSRRYCHGFFNKLNLEFVLLSFFCMFLFKTLKNKQYKKTLLILRAYRDSIFKL